MAITMSEVLPPIPCVCVICRSPQGEIKQTAPLCSGCREQLTKFRIPSWLKVTAICITLIVLYTAIRLPRVIMASIVWDKGQAAWDAHNYRKAETYYEATLNYYPNNPSILGRLASAADKGGDKEKFGFVMDKLAQMAKTDPQAATELGEVLLREKGPPR